MWNKALRSTPSAPPAQGPAPIAPLPHSRAKSHLVEADQLQHFCGGQALAELRQVHRHHLHGEVQASRGGRASACRRRSRGLCEGSKKRNRQGRASGQTAPYNPGAYRLPPNQPARAPCAAGRGAPRRRRAPPAPPGNRGCTAPGLSKSEPEQVRQIRGRRRQRRRRARAAPGARAGLPRRRPPPAAGARSSSSG